MTKPSLQVEGQRVRRKFLQTLWVLKLNPSPPTFTLLDQWVRRHGTVEEALCRKIMGR